MDRRSKNGAPGPSALNERSNVNATSKIATRSSVTTRAQANKKSPTAAKRHDESDNSFDLDADLGVDFQKFGIGVVETEDQLRSADKKSNDDYKYPENDTYEKLLHDYDLLLDSYEVLEAKEKLGFRERELLKRENSLLKRENELLVNKVSDLELQLRPASHAKLLQCQIHRHPWLHLRQIHRPQSSQLRKHH
uniref:Uncharacterized protein n=1 Tax=Anopheles maculatus TaxID=74869 RepID=A0A182T5P8_9DIPT